MFGDDEAGTPTEDRSRISAGLVAVAVAGAVLVAFMVQNPDRVRVELLVWDLTVALWLLVLASAVVGALVGSAVGAVRRRRRR